MSITLVSIYPALLGTYGDGGNVMTLRHRARLEISSVLGHGSTFTCHFPPVQVTKSLSPDLID